MSRIQYYANVAYDNRSFIKESGCETVAEYLLLNAANCGEFDEMSDEKKKLVVDEVNEWFGDVRVDDPELEEILSNAQYNARWQ